MTKILFGGLVLALACLPALAGSAGVNNSKSPTMRFEWHVERPSDSCGKSCLTWISAVGPITERTSDDFAAFAAQKDPHGAIFVLDSEGGSVVDTIKLGHMLRDLDLTTTVGTTVIGKAADGSTTIKLSHAAACESMCGFILLGGIRRYVPPEARVLVHQIWLSRKRDHPETANYSADEIALVEHDIGSLARYTEEMGGGSELLQAALRVPPWQPLYRLTNDEIQRMHLSNVDHLIDAQPHEAVATAARGATVASAPLP